MEGPNFEEKNTEEPIEFSPEAVAEIKAQSNGNEARLTYLRALNSQLEGSISRQKSDVLDQLKWAIPFYPIKEAIEDESYRGFNVTVGLTGMNVPMGLAFALNEAEGLIGKYRLMLKTRKEIYKRVGA